MRAMLTHVENQIRSEQGLSLRTHYGVNKIGDLVLGGSGPKIIDAIGTSLFYGIDGNRIGSGTASHPYD